MYKLPAISIWFWIMKICATTLGETAGDLLSMTLHIGYGISSVMLFAFFIITLLLQLLSKAYHPIIYWLVIVSTSTVGTTISDYMDRTLGLGYALGSGILVTLLIAILVLWFLTEKTLSVATITTKRAELFYWITILFSNTLGTALGDFLADNSGLGFVGGALLIATLLVAIIILYYFTKVSHIILFWIAFVLTRPFGATFGDLLTKTYDKGGLNLGTIGSSIVLFTLLAILVVKAHYKENKIG